MAAWPALAQPFRRRPTDPGTLLSYFAEGERGAAQQDRYQSYFFVANDRRMARPSTAAAPLGTWDDDEDDVDATASAQPQQPLPTHQDLCELAGEDSVDQIRELVLRSHGLHDASLEPLLTPLSSLEVLSLSNNCLRTLVSFPSFANLTTLNVNFNSIGSLEPLVVCTNLEKLYAASNKISSIAPLAALERLRTLSLYRNRLGSLDGCLDVLAGLLFIDELDLGANPCATGPAYRHTLVASLGKLATLDGDALSDLDRELAASYIDKVDADAHEAALLFGDEPVDAAMIGESASAGASRAPTARLGTAGRPGSSGGGKAQVLTLDGPDDAPPSPPRSAAAADRSTITADAYRVYDSDDDDGHGEPAEVRARAAAMAAAAEAADAEEHAATHAPGASASRPGTALCRPGTASSSQWQQRPPTTSSSRAGLAHNGTAANVLSSRPGTAATRPGTGVARPGTASRRPGTGRAGNAGGALGGSGRPGTAAGAGDGDPLSRPTTANPRPSSIFRDPWLNNNAILLEYLSQAEIEKHHQGSSGPPSRPPESEAVDGVPRPGSSAARPASSGGEVGGTALSSPRLELPDGTSAGVMSLRRPLVERLRMTAQAMDSAANANVAELVASNLFSGGESAAPDDAAAELRELIIAVQDLTAERDEARADLAKIRDANEGGEEGEELARLRAENVALRAENANMFTLMEENAALRTEVETMRLKLESAPQPDSPAGAPQLN